MMFTRLGFFFFLILLSQCQSQNFSDMALENPTDLGHDTQTLEADAIEEVQDLWDEQRIDDDGFWNFYDLTESNLFPEGIVYDPLQKRFLLSSLKDGHITQLSRDGNQGLFASKINAPIAGLAIDVLRRQLWACRMGEDSAVLVYDLDSGTQLKTFALAQVLPNASCNDLDLSPKGWAYVSDPNLPNIYRIIPDQGPELWLKDPNFQPQLSGLGLNGLVVLPNGKFLITARFLPPQLFLVDLETQEIHTIQCTGDAFKGRSPLSGADGLIWGQGQLYAVFNDRFFELHLSQDLQHAQVKALDLPSPGWTTGTMAEDRVYIVQGQSTAYVLHQEVDGPFKVLRVFP